MVKKQPAKPSTSKSKATLKPNVKNSSGSAKKTSNGKRVAYDPPTRQPLPSTVLDSAHQQKLLNIFQSTFNSVLSSGTFETVLKEVKTALFHRDFDKAFGSEKYLDTYAARWSPTRALCYASVLAGIEPYLAECSHTPTKDPLEDVHDAAKHGDNGVGVRSTSSSSSPRTLKVLAIGGAAAEAVACGSYLSQQNQRGGERTFLGEITLLDVAPWACVVEKLRIELTTPPTLTKYASAAAQAANAALVSPDQLRNVTFRQHDVFCLDKDELTSLLAVPEQQPVSVLVTLLFTLNELFTAGGIGKTTAFLLTLTSVLSSGSMLLVIDSPGSYSETTIGKEAKRYPMQWLLDKILLGTASEGDDDAAEWEKVESADSVWFRLGQELRYPIPLEDMRYQMHLYRRCGAEGVSDGD